MLTLCALYFIFSQSHYIHNHYMYICMFYVCMHVYMYYFDHIPAIVSTCLSFPMNHFFFPSLPSIFLLC